MKSNPVKVLLVDDNPAVCEALRWALEDTSDFVVVGTTNDGVSAIQYATNLEPDVVILDIALPFLDGFAVARALKNSFHAPIIIFLSIHNTPRFRQEAVEAGGDAFVEKSLGWSVLIAHIRKTIARRTI
ncbi:MAG: response regulator transcription factor [Fibrella sp.]|nr:response regulator transcription factor [Armatimonadota bacterium]